LPAALKTRVEGGGKQTLKAQAALRALLLQGELPPGERLSEEAMVERVGVSRTPVRLALVRLEEEGMLEALPSGGFTVRAFTERDVLAAIEIRGTLEGLAARFAAERRPSAREMEPLRASLAELEAVLRDSTPFPLGELAAYATLNDHFHALVANLAGSRALSRQLERAAALPFASSSGLVLAQSKVSDVQTYLVVAQDQHQGIVDAIERHEGGRAESLMREHARLSTRNLARILRDPEALVLVPGSALIVRDGAVPGGG